MRGGKVYSSTSSCFLLKICVWWLILRHAFPLFCTRLHFVMVSPGSIGTRFYISLLDLMFSCGLFALCILVFEPGEWKVCVQWWPWLLAPPQIFFKLHYVLVSFSWFVIVSNLNLMFLVLLFYRFLCYSMLWVIYI